VLFNKSSITVCRRHTQIYSRRHTQLHSRRHTQILYKENRKYALWSTKKTKEKKVLLFAAEKAFHDTKLYCMGPFYQTKPLH
jgi:hypothetical protein